MRAGEFHTGIRGSVELFRELDLLLVPNLLTSLVPSEEYKEVAYSEGVSYTELYRAGLDHRAYNVLLTDFGYLQFYRSQTGQRVDLRYAYYPTPFASLPYEEFRLEFAKDYAEGDAYELYLQFLDESKALTRTPAIRYDLALGQYREFVHPTSHFHFGLHEDNRWPVSRVLTPEAFSLLIAKHFYLYAWTKHAAEHPA